MMRKWRQLKRDTPIRFFFHQKTFIKTEAQHPNHVHPHSPLVWLSTKKRRLKVFPESFDFEKMFKSSPTTLEGRSPQDCPTPECSRWLCCLEIGAWRNGGGWRTYAICNMQYAISNVQYTYVNQCAYVYVVQSDQQIVAEWNVGGWQTFHF